ncbi:MAG: N-acetyltransferase family protein [Caldilineaceae bacterium]
MDLIIRPVMPEDVPSIHAIYSESVLTYTASWELTPPTEDEMRRRVLAILDQGFPYFVGLLDQKLVGYTYASTYRPRPGYRFTVEDSIYVNPAYRRRGIARQLLSTLIDACTAKGFRQMMAVIGDSDNMASITLHRNLGFEQVGLFRNIGFKFDRWLDGVYMQRALGDGAKTLPED